MRLRCSAIDSPNPQNNAPPQCRNGPLRQRQFAKADEWHGLTASFKAQLLVLGHGRKLHKVGHSAHRESLADPRTGEARGVRSHRSQPDCMALRCGDLGRPQRPLWPAALGTDFSNVYAAGNYVRRWQNRAPFRSAATRMRRRSSARTRRLRLALPAGVPRPCGVAGGDTQLSLGWQGVSSPT